MTFKIIECEQRSEAWYSARAGRATGSRADAILAKIKSGDAAARRDYRLQLAVERMTGRPMESGYVSADMQRGIDLEAAARYQYTRRTGNVVNVSGFIQRQDVMAGCSLDGDINEFEGLLEMKCPKSTTHIGYLRGARAPLDYLPQMRHNLWVTGARWCDFVSYDDRLPDGLDWFCVRVYASDVDLPGYERELAKFLDEVEAEHLELQQLRAAS